MIIVTTIKIDLFNVLYCVKYLFKGIIKTAMSQNLAIRRQTMTKALSDLKEMASSDITDFYIDKLYKISQLDLNSFQYRVPEIPGIDKMNEMIVFNTLRIFTLDKSNKIHPDAINYTNNASQTNLYELILLLVQNPNYARATFHASKQKSLSPLTDIHTKTVNDKEILHTIYELTYEPTSKLFCNASDIDLTLLYKYCIIHFFKYEKMTRFKEALLLILSRFDNKVLNNFIDAFILSTPPLNVLCDKNLFNYVNMFEKNTLNVYLEIVQSKPELTHEYVKYLIDNLEGTRSLWRTQNFFDDLHDNESTKFNKDTTRIIFDMWIVWYNANCIDSNVLYSLIKFFMFYSVKILDVTALCIEDDKYRLVFRNIGSILFDSHNSSTYYNRRATNTRTRNLELLFVICYLNDEFNECSQNVNVTYEKFCANSSFYIDTDHYDSKVCVNLDLIDNNCFVCKILKSIKNTCNINDQVINWYDVTYYYCGPRNSLNHAILKNNVDMILYVLERIESESNQLIEYLKKNVPQDKVITAFLNYKICLDNKMLEEYLSSLHDKTIFDDEFTGKNLANGDILCLLFDVCIEELDKGMIKKYLIGIINNFILSPNLVSKLNVTLDELYYICYLTNNIRENKENFKGLKYQMREMAMNDNLINFNRFTKENDIEPDNYCYELCARYNKSRNMIKYFDETYVPTIYSISNTTGTSRRVSEKRVRLLAKKMQTKEYMEELCTKC